MKSLHVMRLSFFTLALAGCASHASAPSTLSTTKNATQTVAIQTVPTGAACSVSYYKGNAAYTAKLMANTSSTFTVPTANPISITCNKSGYQTTTKMIHPSAEGFPTSITVKLNWRNPNS